jgi:transketolase
MAAAMNGIAVHRGLIPCGGTFLTFPDYARPAIRLAAFMGLGVIYVMTHDSIGLGEDGPTHHPVEHLAALRAMPSLYVYRPADAVETAECWALALQRRDGPSLLALSRQSLPLLRREAHSGNRSAQGAYVLAETEGSRHVTLLATGSEVSIAMTARDALEKEGIRAAVVSMPCRELSGHAPKHYQDVVLGSGPRVAVEAAVEFGWERWLGSGGVFTRNERFRRLGSRRGAFSAFRHHPRKGCRDGPLAPIDRSSFRRTIHGGTGCDQWFWPHRPAGPAGGARAPTHRG